MSTRTKSQKWASKLRHMMKTTGVHPTIVLKEFRKVVGNQFADWGNEMNVFQIIWSFSGQIPTKSELFAELKIKPTR